MRKPLFIIVALLLTSCSTPTPVVAPGKVVGCESVPRDVNESKGLFLECLDGSQGLSLGALRGPMIVNVWGSWCAPCLDEIPEFRSFYAKAQGKISLIGVDVEEPNPEAGRTFVVDQGMTWPNFYDRDNKSRGYFGMGVPVTWFIGQDGKVLYKKIGAIASEVELIDLTEKYLGIKIS